MSEIVINYYAELDEHLEKLGEAPAGLGPDMSYKDMKAACRKLRKTWANRANAVGPTQETAQNIVATLNIISEKIGNEEEKQVYDALIREALAEEAKRKEEERILREQALERERLFKQRMREQAEQIRKEEERKAAEEARRLYEARVAEENARKEALRKKREQELEEQRYRDWKRRAFKPSILGLAINLALVALIIWPALSWAGFLPKFLAFAPTDAYRQHLVQTAEKYADNLDRWESAAKKDFRKDDFDFLPSLFERQNANDTASDDWFAYENGDRILAYDGNYLFQLGIGYEKQAAIPFHQSKKENIYIGYDMNYNKWDGNYLITADWVGERVIKSESIATKKGSATFYKEFFKKKSAEEIRLNLFECLKHDSKSTIDDYFACAYAKASGILLAWQDNTAYFAENEDGVITLYAISDGEGSCRKLAALERSYEGTGAGYFMKGNLFVYADGKQVKSLDVTDPAKAESSLITLNNPVYLINYTVCGKSSYLITVDQKEGKINFTSFKDQSTVTTLSFEADRNLAVFANEGTIWIFYQGQYPAICQKFVQQLDAAQPLIYQQNKNSDSIWNGYTLYNMTMRKIIGDSQSSYERYDIASQLNGD